MTQACSIEAGLVSWVLEQPTLKSLQGRFYATEQLPKGTAYPAGTLSSIGGNAEPTLDTRGMQRERFQFSFGGDGRSDVRALVDALSAALDGFSGTLPNGFAVVDAEWIGPVKLPYDSDARKEWFGCEFYLRFSV